ncbi:taste receptor type 2 member 3-like [Choloepus didactylus]|uniref:taste receptor type 2 member 3-like n=1 Tax=Choloepus didactylus TaxID=27675 RepID=UPI0018A04035|nr:taste receptor type 2 member 3-like [Choloepus didactylus]
MLELAKWVFLILFVTEFILGMLGNGFIVLINGSTWLKSKRISLSDFIITNLALSRVVLLGIILTDSTLLVFFFKWHESGIVMQVTDLFWTFTNHLNLWLATCLSVFYCLKIASFSHPMFLWLKWRVSRVVVWMLLGALLSSCGSTMSLIHEFKIYSGFRGICDTGNVSEHFRKRISEYDLIHVLGTLWNLPALIISLASYLLLIFSLGKHTQQMQHNGTSSRDPRTEAHKRAIKIILSFLLLVLLYFLAFLIAFSSHFLPDSRMVDMIGEVFIMFYPTGHTFILILGNNKLKQTFVEMLQCEYGHLKPGSKEPISP